jgi:hypothetical protein
MTAATSSRTPNEDRLRARSPAKNRVLAKPVIVASWWTNRQAVS